MIFCLKFKSWAAAGSEGRKRCRPKFKVCSVSDHQYWPRVQRNLPAACKHNAVTPNKLAVAEYLLENQEKIGLEIFKRRGKPLMDVWQVFWDLQKQKIYLFALVLSVGRYLLFGRGVMAQTSHHYLKYMNEEKPGHTNDGHLHREAGPERNFSILQVSVLFEPCEGHPGWNEVLGRIIQISDILLVYYIIL